MANPQSPRRSLLLPQLNPFIPFLLDAYTFLNESLQSPAASPRRVYALARASTMHTLAALHAAANSALRYEDQPMMPEASLSEKFSLYRIILNETAVTDEDGLPVGGD